MPGKEDRRGPWDAAPVLLFILVLVLHGLLVNPSLSLRFSNEDVNWLLAITGLARDSVIDDARGACTTMPVPTMPDATPTSMVRVGVPAMAAPLFLFFGTFGLRLVHGLGVATAALLTYVLALRVGRSRGIALMCMALVALHPTILFWEHSGDSSTTAVVPRPFHSNRPVLLLVTSLLATLLLRGRPSTRTALAMGIVYGAACGVLHILIVLAVPILWWLAHASRRERALLAFALGAVITVIPWMLWYQSMCGSVFVHPTQGCLIFCDPTSYRDEVLCDRSRMASADGEEQVHPQRIGSMTFPFYGRLNFQSGIIRTPGYPYPVFVLAFLRILAWLGVPLTAMALIGIGDEERRWMLVAALLWFATYFIVLSPQESWDWGKERLFLPFIPPVVVFLTIGTARVLREPHRLWHVMGVVIALVAVLTLLARVEVAPDPTWQLLFPQEHLAPVLYARERRIAEVREEVTAPRILPAVARTSTFGLNGPARHELAPPAEFDDPALRPGLDSISQLPEGAVVLIQGDVDLVQAATQRCAIPLMASVSPASPLFVLDIGRVRDTLCTMQKAYLYTSEPVGYLGESVVLGEGDNGVHLLTLTPDAQKRYC